MRLLRNQRGDAFVMAMILVVASGVLFLSTQVAQKAAIEKMQIFRMRTQMNFVQTRIRQALQQPKAFQGCQTALGPSSCHLNLSYLKSFENIPILGATCEGSDKFCGFSVDGWSFDGGLREVKFTLSFNGKFSLKPLNMKIKIPDEILQEQSFDCAQIDPSKPIFVGIDPGSGRVQCRSIPTCGKGQYMRGVNAANADVLCSPIPTTTITCPATQMISSFSWQGATEQHTCVDRLDPYTRFGGP